jgi:hypothetical protein
MKRTILILGFLGLVGGCDGGGMDAPGVDAGSDVVRAVDTLPCTLWGCVVTCLDSGCGCEMVCKSHDPAMAPKCPTSLPCE